MIRKIILPVIFTFPCLFAAGQNFKQQFTEMRQKEDTAGQLKVLHQWEVANSKDVELFIAWFNYYAAASRAEIVSLSANNKDGKAFKVTDSTGNTAGYLGSAINYDPVILAKGFEYINKGIALYPQRLDMRFGKIYMLGQEENYEAFAKTIVETIDYDNTINHAWLWKEGKPLEDAKEFFLGSMQDYVSTIYNTGDDSLLPLMRQVSEEVLKFYPQHVESLSNVAITYIITGNYDKGLEYLLKAETVNSKDVIVLNNIAAAYAKKGDKAKAKEYFKKVIAFGNKEEAADAKEKMKNL